MVHFYVKFLTYMVRLIRTAFWHFSSYELAQHPCVLFLRYEPDKKIHLLYLFDQFRRGILRGSTPASTGCARNSKSEKSLFQVFSFFFFIREKHRIINRQKLGLEWTKNTRGVWFLFELGIQRDQYKGIEKNLSRKINFQG